MQERQRSWSAVLDWTSCRVQASFRALSVALEWAVTASSAMAASTGCTRNAMVPGNCTPLGWQTTEGSPGRTWQAWGGSFLLLPRRHTLSSRWLWTFNHNTCENHLEEVQGSATSPLFMPPLFQNTWSCVRLLCAEHNALCQQDLATDKAESPASAAKCQGNDQTDLQCLAARHCHHQVQWATCAAWHWGSGPHSEGEKTPMVWTCGTLKWCNQDSLWHTGWWKAWAWEAQNDKEAADREELQRVEALGYQPSWSGDLVWDLPCVQQASYLEGSPLMWMLPLYLHVNQKSDYDYIWWFHKCCGWKFTATCCWEHVS